MIAYEKVTLYGLPIVGGRARSTTAGSTRSCRRDLFIRHALVEGDWRTHHQFLAATTGSCSTRSRSWRTGRGAATSWSTTRRCSTSTTGGSRPTWSRAGTSTPGGRGPGADRPDLLDLHPAMLVNATRRRRRRAGGLSRTTGSRADLRLPLSYQFEPGTDADGVTVADSAAGAQPGRADGFDWQIPGLREELVTALIRSLPKQLRRNFVPVPDFARAVLRACRPGAGAAAGRAGTRAARVDRRRVPRDAWELGPLPEHLKITSGWSTGADKRLAEGKDLAALKQQLGPQGAATLSAAPDAIERGACATWDFGTLPRVHGAGPGEGPIRRWATSGDTRRHPRRARPRPSSAGRCGAAPGGCCC